MVADELFKFTIIDYTTNPSGDTYTIDEPVGWDGVEFELARLDTHGFVNRINIDGITFEFHDIAKDVLIAAYDNYGVEAKVELKIEWKGKPSDSYSQIYLGLFKFSTYKKICGFKCKVTCGVSQAGSYYLFHNRKSQPIDLSSLSSFDGSIGFLPYTWLNKEVTIPAKLLQLENNLEGTIGSFGANLGTLTCDIIGVDTFNVFINYGFDTINVIQLNDQLTVSSIIMYDNAAITPTNNLLQEYLTQGGSPFYQRNGENENILCTNTYEIYLNYDVEVIFTSNTIQTFNVSQVSMYAWILRLDGSIDMFYTGTPQSVPSGSSTFNLTFVDNILIGGLDIKIGEQLFMGTICIDVQGDSCAPVSCDLSISSITNLFEYRLTVQSACENTNAKVSLINEVFARQVESYTSNEMTIYSDYFGRTDAQPYTSAADGCGSLEALSKGLQIRGALNNDNTEYSLVASFDDIFKNLDAIHNIGYGEEPDIVKTGAYKWIRIEPYEYFYQSDILLEADYPNEVELAVDAENIYQGVAIGYNSWATEEEGGLQDLFATRMYSTLLTRASNTLSILSDFVASDFALEVSRRMFGSSKKDFRYDDNVFIICMARDGVDIVVEQGQTEVAPATPLIDSSSYIYSPETQKNSRITPIRNLMRHVKRIIRYLKPSIVWGLTFKEGKANYVAGIKHNDNPCIVEGTLLPMLYENDSLAVNSFENTADGYPILSSDNATFEYPLNCAEWSDILANPYGKVGYKCPQDTGYTYGWIKQLKYNPTKGLATFTLIKEYTS